MAGKEEDGSGGVNALLLARHGDSVATCLIVDPVKRNRKANKAKRDGVGGSSHEKMLERSRRYRENHIFSARERVLRYDREHPEKRRERYRRWKAIQQEVLCKPL